MKWREILNGQGQTQECLCILNTFRGTFTVDLCTLYNFPYRFCDTIAIAILFMMITPNIFVNVYYSKSTWIS